MYTKIVPTWISTDITISMDGDPHHLRPKKDITAYELFNINKWIEEVRLNQLGFKSERFYQRAEELEITRHFVRDEVM